MANWIGMRWRILLQMALIVSGTLFLGCVTEKPFPSEEGQVTVTTNLRDVSQERPGGSVQRTTDADS